jgi:hypothetical protein
MEKDVKSEPKKIEVKKGREDPRHGNDSRVLMTVG